MELPERSSGRKGGLEVTLSGPEEDVATPRLGRGETTFSDWLGGKKKKI